MSDGKDEAPFSVDEKRAEIDVPLSAPALREQARRPPVCRAGRDLENRLRGLRPPGAVPKVASASGLVPDSSFARLADSTVAAVATE